jgi:hydrogenase large subunit
MPVFTAAIDPVTRIEGHLKVEVDIDTLDGVRQVVDARSTGTLFRGFEKVLEGRDPRDAPIITSRICGVCPTAHSMAAVLMLDDVFQVTPAAAGHLLRNLVHATCFVESDILHFYLLCLPDYIAGPGMAPWQPTWDVGRRLDQRSVERLLGHYLQAVHMRRKTHEMGAIFGGKLPHTPGFIPGGFTATPDGANKAAFGALLQDIVAFIENTYIPDAELLASLYDDYFSIGAGYGNLLSFGVFAQVPGLGAAMLLQPGRAVNGVPGVQALDLARIREQVTCSWYEDRHNNLHPANGETEPISPKGAAYSWLKAPRYDGANYEVGPLSRMVVTGDYAYGVSVMDRHLARARECLKIARAMQDWLAALPTGPLTIPALTWRDAVAAGVTEAPRGALGHWIEVSGQKIRRYQVVTPTCWNCSPRDSDGRRGPMEEALVGTPVARADQPVEVLRVIHSFDPCLDCATHVMRPGDRRAVVVRSGRGGRSIETV